MQLGAFLAVMLRPAFVPVRLLQGLQQTFIVDQAPGWFVGPMVLMLLVAFIDQTGPAHSLFEAGFDWGFWNFLAFSGLSVLIAWTFQAFPETGAFEEREGDGQHPRTPGRDRGVTLQALTRELSSETLGSIDSDSEGSCSENVWRMRGRLGKLVVVAGLLSLLAVVMAALCIGLTRPFLSFEYRVSDVAIKRAEPPVLELWYQLGDLCRPLQLFAAFTCAGVLLVWVPLVLLRLAEALGVWKDAGEKVAEDLRRTELFFRPWVMVELWAVAVLLIYYICTSRNKGVIEVCAAFPDNPQGLLAICVLFLASKGLMMTAKSSLSPAPPTLPRPRSRPVEPPGGGLLWNTTGGLMFVFWLLLLYFHGPLATREITQLADFNRALGVLLPLTNEKLRRKLPHSAGDCDQFWQQRVQTGQEPFEGSKAEFHKSCRGKKPLGSYRKKSVVITAEWVTGVNSLKITDMTVHPPLNPSAAKQHWDMTIAGQFTDLHLWLNVKWGKRELINNYISLAASADKPFHFSLAASANCSAGSGFQGIELGVAHIDEIQWTEHMNNLMPSHNLGGVETSVEVDYGSHSAVEDALRNALTMQTGHLIVRSPDGSETNPLESVGSVVSDVVRLNTGESCPGHGAGLVG
jgi:hypothetical protein